jgi:YVTN family beta-propeller protein
MSKTYVTNSGSNTISVIDGKTNKVVATIPVSNFPRGIAVADNGLIYTTNSGSDNVSVIDGKTNKVVATIPSGYLPNGVASDETYSKIYVTNSGSNNISVINGANNIESTENHYCDTK